MELAEQEERSSRFLESIAARQRLANERSLLYSSTYARFQTLEDVEKHRKALTKAAFREAYEARRPLVEDMVERRRIEMNEALDVLVLRSRPSQIPITTLNPNDVASMLSHTSNSNPKTRTAVIVARPVPDVTQSSSSVTRREGGVNGNSLIDAIESDEAFARRLHEEELRALQRV
jgi:hypothetical protein